MLVACGSSPLVVDGGQDRADAVQDVADSGPLDGDSGDLAPGDAIDTAATLECADMTCGAGYLCLRTRGGLDGSPDWFRCESIPAACATTPTCDCLKI